MERVDKGDYVGSLLLDFYKAFDTVPHQLLNFLQNFRLLGAAVTALLGWDPDISAPDIFSDIFPQ